MTRTPLLLAVLAAATALALSACADGGASTADGPSTTVDTTTADRQPGAPDAATEHNDADVMFAQMMLPHHEEAIEMSDIVLSANGIPEDVTRLAREIKGAQGPEIRQLTDWLEQWGETTEARSGGMSETAGMEGMLTDDEMAALVGADGAAAARMFLEQMIAHHEGAVSMAEDQVLDGGYRPAIDMARDIIETQQREIASMTELLEAL